MELGADRIPCDELITTKQLFLEMSRTHSSRSAVSVTLLVFPDRKYGEDALWIHD